MAEKTTLPKSVFAVEVRNHELLKLAYDSYLANNRLASATTKQRGEVRGGGKKPWRQKGTGRARFGSIRNPIWRGGGIVFGIRNPIWRGGGIVFGPRGNENYTKKISKTSKRVALRQALTVKADKVLVADIKTTGKTAEVAKFLKENNLNRRVLIVAEKTDELIRATNNISEALLVSPMYLNVFDILNADHIVIAPKAIETIENWLGGEK